ncbi:hypothetical protein CU098_006293 [Rhizopus stolonifer]|uniref:Uncharacterized protein n=1 Tax=Rhizopus stolonifer TaxID=4846 RepID=A0A367JJ42_RHIST|nr:hypothetical protein CU098_006293 [Rhizopus stolonifer]
MGSLYYQYRPLPIPEDHQPQFKSIFTKDTDTQTMKVWKSNVVIGADGQTSFVRQKLGIPLRNNHGSTKATRIFYTLQINIITTNFPGAKHISVICKKKDILYIIGHQHQFFVTFEHKPSWSKVSVDQEIPVQLAIEHIRSVLEPYKVEFGKVKNYTRWNGGDQSVSEEYSTDASCFFIGSAAQLIHPPGMFDINMHLTQVHNLCWKLALHLSHRACPQLLQTFESEMRHKTEEVMYVSTLFMNFIGDYYKLQEEEGGILGLNSSHTRDLVYQLERLKSCFVGDTPFLSNMLNHQAVEQDLLSLNEDDLNQSTSSFVFMAPPPSTTAPIEFQKSQPGCLAPNAKLKPYTLFQLLFMTSSQNTTNSKLILSPTISSKTLPIPQKPLSPPPPPSSSSSQTELELEELKRNRSNSATTGNLSSTLLAVFQKNLNSGLKKRNSTQSTPSAPPVTPIITASALISPERWKSIKTNHHQLSERIHQLNKGLTFTLLIFCGPLLQDSIERVQSFVRRFNSPLSFIHRYEYDQFYNNNRHSVGDKSLSSISTCSSSFDFRKSSLDTPRTSFDSQYQSPDNHSTSPLFSMIFITSSCKNEATRYLNNTPPAIVHSTFPCGLAQVFIDHDQQCYKAYDISHHQPEVVVVRPDGYIGTRVTIDEDQDASFERLCHYFDSFLRPFVDMNSAAAVVAAGYDC